MKFSKFFVTRKENIFLGIEKGKILIEGMDLSGKTTVVNYLSKVLEVENVQERTLSKKSEIYDFTVEQSKKGKLHQDLINRLYTLAITEDLYNYKPGDGSIVLQDSYFALKSYALMKERYPNTLAKEVFNLLKLFPKPQFTFYLTASTEERIRRSQQRDKPMAYMENLLMSNPKEFEKIEENLKKITTNLFDAYIIDTQSKTPNQIAMYIGNIMKKTNRKNDLHERELFD